MSKLCVVIPTKERPELLEQALNSVINQSVHSDKVVVVTEADDPTKPSVRRICKNLSDTLEVSLIDNTRTHNLSGAVNSGLSYLLELDYDPVETYIAFLDDDDAWDEDYLDECYNAAIKGNHDWVYAGIVRHESDEESGIYLTIPSDLKVEDFLVGNPHIQGSNLFVRFSAILRAGCFDEALDSTTDRDLCIRLLESGNLRIHRLDEHLVHHNAPMDARRLSTPGSSQKEQGLFHFYLKYAPRMNSDQLSNFKTRAFSVFQTDIDELLNRREVAKKQSDTQENRVVGVSLVVGLIVTRIESLKRLLENLNCIQSEGGLIARVVLLDNTTETEHLLDIVGQEKYTSLALKVVSRDNVQRAIEEGGFSQSVTFPEYSESISGGRTVLHYYLYNEMGKVPNGVGWVIDDDIRLSYLSEDEEQRLLTASEITTEVVRLREMGAAIAALRITGDPPVPGMSLLRTQLLDLYYNLGMIDSGTALSRRIIYHRRCFLSSLGEYFYDYSTNHYSHLEFPSFREIQPRDSLLQLTYGKAVTRPRLYPAEVSEDLEFVPLGGSYFVLNPECLRDFPVISPEVNGLRGRRGDTLWGILNRYVRGRSVVQSSLAVQQARLVQGQNILSPDRFFSDIVGSAFVRALSRCYLALEVQLGELPARVPLTLTKQMRSQIIAEFENHLSNRRVQFLLNAYRIQGLLHAIRHSKAFDSGLHDIQELVLSLEDTFSDASIREFSKNLDDIDQELVDSFLVGLKGRVKSFRGCFEPIGDSARSFTYSRDTVSALTSQDRLEYLGSGREAHVWTDESHAYKHMRYGWSQFQSGQAAFLRERILQRHISDKIARLDEIIERNEQLVFRTELCRGEAYSGGYLKDIIKIVGDCRKSGIAITNFHPDNLIVTADGLKFCDLGRSLVPLTEREFEHMARRAFLTYRFHFRDDLDDLIARSLYDKSMPEMVGFDLFLDSLNNTTKSQVLDELLLRLIRLKSPATVMDYGCGKGPISERLAADGIEVVAFDIDSSLIQQDRLRHTPVWYITEEGLETLLENGAKYDLVLCSLVLCTLESNTEVKRVVSKIRDLVAEEGCALVSICNPFFCAVPATNLHEKEYSPGRLEYDDKFLYKKRINETGRTRTDIHRPFSWYKHLFHQCGFEIVDTTESRTVDTSQLLPSSDFLTIELNPLPQPKTERVSLLIKASPMEWKTIGFQIRHIVNQLEGPQEFCEKIVITDSHEGPFLRAYDEPNHEALRDALDEIVADGIVDRVVYAPYDSESIRSTYLKWFGIESEESHSKAGQHLYTTLYGFGECSGDFILQADSDCIIYRSDRGHDYLGEMLDVLQGNPRALTVSFNIASSRNRPYTCRSESGPWRVEVRFCLLHKDRLVRSLPLPNALTPEGKLADAWHRSLDKLIESSELESYRGGSVETSYVHMPNARKRNANEWFNIIESVERGNLPECQKGSVNLKGSMADWIGRRNEAMVLIVRGRNTYLPRLRRCIDSILSQSDSNAGVILIDAGSRSGAHEYMEEIVYRQLGERVSILRNHTPLPAIENILVATTEICDNLDSIIIHLDADDSLIGSDVLAFLRGAYSDGCDVTVGGMLRLDKKKEYPVNFTDPRGNRGGNVWQHLRSFRKHLFDSIREEDLKVDGEWIPIAEDWAFMLPIVEMARSPLHVTRPLYLYEPGEPMAEKIRDFRERVIGRIVKKQRYSQCDLRS